MTIEEAKLELKQLNLTLQETIRSFEEKTNLRVTDVCVYRQESGTGGVNFEENLYVNTKVEIND